MTADLANPFGAFADRSALTKPCLALAVFVGYMRWGLFGENSS